MKGLSQLEAAWRAWERLCMRDKAQFSRRQRQVTDEERNRSVALNGRGRGPRVPDRPLETLDVGQLDFGPDR